MHTAGIPFLIIKQENVSYFPSAIDKNINLIYTTKEGLSQVFSRESVNFR